jgi:chromosomal replication initiator protein
LSPDYTFENFIVGPESRLAHAAAEAVSEGLGTAYNPLFIYGGVGLGKTHLLQAVCQRLLDDNSQSIEIHYVSCEGFMTQFMEAVKAGQMADFRHRFRDVDCLVIDDIQFLAKRDRTQEEFFHTFNTLYQSGKQIVLSSDRPPQDIADLEARLVSRFQSGLVVEMNPPSYETRVEIVKQKGRIRGMDIPDDVACFIAAKVSNNIRELEGAVVRVHMLHRTDGKAIGMELAQMAVDPRGRSMGGLKPEITITNIIDGVVDYYGVKLTDLQSKRRQKSIAHPRQVCMYLARKHTRYSLEEIGGYFGGRDHTTVMHAVRTIERKRDEDEQLSRVIEALEQRFVQVV